MIKQVLSPENKETFRIEYMIGNTCNYKCWYCFADANTGTHRWNEDYDLVLKNFLHLCEYQDKNNNKKHFDIFLAGGEPTLWPMLGNFVQDLKHHLPSCTISMSSNASRTLRWWQEYSKYFDKILLSCHHESVDIEHFIKVADTVHESGTLVNTMVLMDATHWDKCTTIIDKLHTSQYPWFITATEVLTDKFNYTKEQIDFIAQPNKRMPSMDYLIEYKHLLKGNPTVIDENNTYKEVERNWISLNNLNNFYGWSCNLGVDSIYIDKDGTLTGSCRHKIYQEEQYNLYQEDFIQKFYPTIKPIVCTKKLCSCQDEIILNKIKL